MNTQENNKLIAEFMGARPIVFSDGTKGHSFWNMDFDREGRYGSFPDGSTNYFDYDKGYNTDWNWLIPVVDKIEEYLSANVGKVGYFDECLISNDLDIRYNAVVEFIKQYNESAD
tara:strand:+ start:979 stop:1323 length:345 start_codon:yes stop_codon:yes gene_type:complete